MKTHWICSRVVNQGLNSRKSSALASKFEGFWGQGSLFEDSLKNLKKTYFKKSLKTWCFSRIIEKIKDFRSLKFEAEASKSFFLKTLLVTKDVVALLHNKTLILSSTHFFFYLFNIFVDRCAAWKWGFLQTIESLAGL